ncbi:tRNA (uracil-O(2)-)-methyltransferase [Nakaseomyces bracarensis]|uniref:tRNA (uracil-O(2)-)-methyltransferase n=1 Tax=Nakaseomyces bracarensis TaxID=273131 RepID=A0ABR4NQR1_9SACH
MSSSFVFMKDDTDSILGGDWVPMYRTNDPVEFSKDEFQAAMLNVIREPNINSTAILRADILSEKKYDLHDPTVPVEEKAAPIDVDKVPYDAETKLINIDDVKSRKDVIENEEIELVIVNEFVRRMIPRNPYKDALINQTCLVYNSKNEKYNDTSLVLYIPHFENEEDCPFYIPHVKKVAILLHQGILSVHYVPYEGRKDELRQDNERVVRTAFRLLQTAHKHSRGVLQGYEKRVNHDQVVDRVLFQDTYIQLKKKYSKFLVDNWAESTDPKKHVFEELAIAAFLLELWKKKFGEDFRNTMQFRDLGCGNGVLTYILISEGVSGIGVDARKRKSWDIYPTAVQKALKEQVIIPSILLRPTPEVKSYMPYLEDNGAMFPMLVEHGLIAPATLVYSSADLIKSPNVNICEYPKNTFVIGNHSDELTCWIPLLGYPFMIIPCCSHNLSGKRVRYYTRTSDVNNKLNDNKNMKVNTNNVNNSNSTYAGLVNHVEDIAKRVGWKVEKEMLRIPSTRNAAIISTSNPNMGKFPTPAVYNTIEQEGGALNWVQSTMKLTKQSPRNH